MLLTNSVDSHSDRMLWLSTPFPAWVQAWSHWADALTFDFHFSSATSMWPPLKWFSTAWPVSLKMGLPSKFSAFLKNLFNFMFLARSRVAWAGLMFLVVSRGSSWADPVVCISPVLRLQAWVPCLALQPFIWHKIVYIYGIQHILKSVSHIVKWLSICISSRIIFLVTSTLKIYCQWFPKYSILSLTIACSVKCFPWSNLS